MHDKDTFRYLCTHKSAIIYTCVCLECVLFHKFYVFTYNVYSMYIYIYTCRCMYDCCVCSICNVCNRCTFFPVTAQYVSKLKTVEDDVQEMWETMKDIKEGVCKMIEHDNDG